ncbi:YD286 protein, partial [Atractosteus spatula]|nr:YD286 protein [Atractosteus spatula]
MALTPIIMKCFERLVMGHIKSNVKSLSMLKNNMSLNVDKTKEMIIDFRRAHAEYSPLHINGSPVETVRSTTFLGVHIKDDLTCTINTTSLGTIESILTNCIMVWIGNCKASDRKSLQQIVNDPCPLCDEAKEVLDPFKDRFILQEVDITLPENKVWFERYKYDIPVFHLNGQYLMMHRVHTDLLEKKLASIEQREHHN